MEGGYEALDMSETPYVKGMRKTNNSNKARPVSLSNNVGGQQQQQQQESRLGAASNKRNAKGDQEKVGGEFTGPLTSPMIGAMEGWMVLLLLAIVIAFGFLIASLIPIYTINKVSDGSWNSEGADGSGGGHIQWSLLTGSDIPNLEKIFVETNFSRGSSRAAIEDYRSYFVTEDGLVVSRCSRGLVGGCDPALDWTTNICMDYYELDYATCQTQMNSFGRFISVITPSVWENEILIVEVRTPAHVLFIDTEDGELLFSHMLDENPESSLVQAGVVDHQDFYLGTASIEEPDSRSPCLRTPMFCELNVKTRMVGWCRSLEDVTDLLEYSTPFVPISGFDIFTWTEDCNVPRQFCSTVPIDDRMCTLGVEVATPIVHPNDVVYFATTDHENYGTNLSQCLFQNTDFESRFFCYLEWIPPYTASDSIVGLNRNDFGTMVYKLPVRDVEVWEWSCDRYRFKHYDALEDLSEKERTFSTRNLNGSLDTVDDNNCTQLGRTLNASVVPCRHIEDGSNCLKNMMYLHNCPTNFSDFLANWERSGNPIGNPSGISAGPMMMPDRSLVFAAGGSVFDVNAGQFNEEEQEALTSFWHHRHIWDQKISYSNAISGVSRTNNVEVVVTVAFQEDIGEDDCLPLVEGAPTPLCGGWTLERPYRSNLHVHEGHHLPHWQFPGPMSGFLNGGALTWRYGQPFTTPSFGDGVGKDYVSSISTKCGGVVTLQSNGIPIVSWIGRDCPDLDCLANATNRLLTPPFSTFELSEKLLNNERGFTQVPYPTYPNCRIEQTNAGFSKPSANTNDIAVLASTNFRFGCVCGQPGMLSEDELCNANITADNYQASLPDGMIYIMDPRYGVTLAEFANYFPFSENNGVTLFNGCIHPIAGASGGNSQYSNVTLIRLCLPVHD